MMEILFQKKILVLIAFFVSLLTSLGAVILTVGVKATAIAIPPVATLLHYTHTYILSPAKTYHKRFKTKKKATLLGWLSYNSAPC